MMSRSMMLSLSFNWRTGQSGIAMALGRIQELSAVR